MSRRILDVRLTHDSEALRELTPGSVNALTGAATGVTFDSDDLTDEQRAANRRVVDISEPTARAAADNPHQSFAAAFVDDRFAGFVIATEHSPGDHELDWLMVHPDFHGTNVANALMRAGMAWLGIDKPMWLNVIRHNARAIRFYEKLGFAIDPTAKTAHIVPHVVMRRVPAAPISRATIVRAVLALVSQVAFYVAYFFFVPGFLGVAETVPSKAIFLALVPSVAAALLAHVVIHSRSTPSWPWFGALWIEALVLVYPAALAAFVLACELSPRACP